MTIDDYFATVGRSLRENVLSCRLEGAPTCLASDDYNGLLRCRVAFWEDSYLDIHEVVNTELGYPVRVSYSYTFVHEGKRVFRYDNAPHHPEILTHPHHKHIGASDRLAPADQPSLGHVLEEISIWLAR